MDFIDNTINIYKEYSTIIPEKFDADLTFFFYGIYKDDIMRWIYFYNTVQESKIQRLINIFETIKQRDFDSYLENPTINPSLNDIFWVLYFSSGNSIYLDRIMAIIEKYNNETKDLMLYMTARSGVWSFRLNLSSHPSVLDYILNYKNSILKMYILENAVEQIRNETVEFVRKQREAGIW
jgi:hypothetical protein